MANILAIIGRPNVGKSTFFNRLVQARKAIVDEMSGVTRDRHYGKAEWNGVEFSVIDTGGYIFGSDDVFEKEIRTQVEIALSEATVILFVVDVTAGVTAQDERVAALLRTSVMREANNKKILLVANKADTYERENLAGEFFKLGMGDVYSISAVSGKGTGELLDQVVVSFKEKIVEDNSHLPKFAIVGRPNAGKSSLLNALLGEERTIVTPKAGTTRDSIHTHYNKYSHEFLLIDTAGIRKKRKYEEDVEFYSNLRAFRAIEECDVVLLMLDAKLGMEAQDVNIFRLAERNKKGVVILVNKWDLIEKQNLTVKEFEEQIKEKIAPFVDVPIVFISALNKQRILRVLEEVGKVYQRRKTKLSDEELDALFLPIIEARQPSSYKGKIVKIFRVAQIPSTIPMLVFYSNLPKAIKESYSRFLENELRRRIKLSGVPVQIIFREK